MASPLLNQNERMVVAVGPGFYNIRSSFKVFGLIEVGTHMSIIKLNSGKFLVIDTVELDDQLKSQIDALTNNGDLIEAVLATHPFHTVYFPAFYSLYPNAQYYGCPRHIRNITTITWKGNFNDEATLKLWETEQIYLRIPDGAEFVNPAESNHFSSVFVFHQPSRTIHVDDTIGFHPNPGCFLRCALGAKKNQMMFWNLQRGLKKDNEAPILFKNFIQKILSDWDFDNACTAHTGNKIGGAKEELRLTLLREEYNLTKLAQQYYS